MLGMQSRLEKIGDLNCTVVAPPDRDQIQAGIVLCHGFGAPGTDLVALAPELASVSSDIAERVEFIFPEAPLSLAEAGYGGGRAWWMIDMEQLQWAQQTGNIRDLRGDRPEGFEEAGNKLDSVLQVLFSDRGWNRERTIVGGFSQGSMVTTDWVLRQTDPVHLLCVMSGTLLNEAEWKQLLEDTGRTSVLQSHGQQDPILPFVAAEWLRDLLTESGFDVDFRPFSGPHTISGEVLKELADRLVKLVEG